MEGKDLISNPLTVSAKNVIMSREEQEQPVIKSSSPKSYVALADPILEYMLDSNGFNSIFLLFNISYTTSESRVGQAPKKDSSENELYVLKIILNESFDLNGNKGVFIFYSVKFEKNNSTREVIKVISIDSKNEYVIAMNFDIFKRYVKDPKTFPDYVKTKKRDEYENTLFANLCTDYFIKAEHTRAILIKEIEEKYLYLYSKKLKKTTIYSDDNDEEQTRLDDLIDFYDKQEYVNFLIRCYFFFLRKKYKSGLVSKTKIKIKYSNNTDIYDINIALSMKNTLIIVLKKDGIETTVLGFRNSKNPNHIYVPRYNLYILIKKKTVLFIIQYDKNNLKLLQGFEYKILFEYNISVTNIEQYISVFEKDVKYLFFKLLFGNIVKDVEVLADVPIQEVEELDSNSYNSKDLKLIDINIASAMKDSKQKDVKKTSKIPSLVSNFSTTSDIRSPPSIRIKSIPKQKTLRQTLKDFSSKMFSRKTRRNTVVPE